MSSTPSQPRKLLGQILIEMEVVSGGQIREGLDMQQRKGGRLGEALQLLGYVTEGEVQAALKLQKGRSRN